MWVHAMLNQSSIFFAVLINFLLLSQPLWAKVDRLCPNACSGHGVCSPNAGGSCHCFPGFVGIDCSDRVCPAAKAWVDFPSADNEAHAPRFECSNMGTCDRSTGLCQCREGFTGAACEMTLCPLGARQESSSSEQAVCSGKGTCMSLRQASVYQDFVSFFGGDEYNAWDADRIFGCICEPGYEGYNCQKLSCPKGDDPNTASSFEVQVVDCQCLTCTGGVVFSYRGQVTPLLPYDAPAVLVQRRLRVLKGLERVVVTPSHGSEMCSEGGSAFSVSFPHTPTPVTPLYMLLQQGLQAPIWGVRRGDGRHSLFNGSVRAVAGWGVEWDECSRHGVCDYVTGTCSCFKGYTSSDGKGEIGNKGDCSYRESLFSNNTVINGTLITPCPVTDLMECSGHGSCSLDKVDNYVCSCEEGYEGLDCSLRSCGLARAWFGANIGTYHSTLAPCANVGECDTSTGKCESCGGDWGIFGGDSCQYFACPKGVNSSLPCGGQGTCLTMRQMAKFGYNDQKELANFVYDEPWDADMIQGCVCARAISVDNYYPTGGYASFLNTVVSNITNYGLNVSIESISTEEISRFYRGPYAYAATDFAGYACQEKTCPKGDDPRSPGVSEIQAISCLASADDINNGGWVLLMFRENYTLPIFLNSSLDTLKTRLEDCFTISKVDVWASNDSALGLDKRFLLPHAKLCSTSANTTIFIEFLGEMGNLPLLKISGYYSPDSSLYFDIYKVQAGTREDVECSRMGICDRSTGRCKCITGYQSSDGSLDNPGQRGDCSYFNPYYNTVDVSATGN